MLSQVSFRNISFRYCQSGMNAIYLKKELQTIMSIIFSLAGKLMLLASKII
jgi:hypothetical protein